RRGARRTPYAARDRGRRRGVRRGRDPGLRTVGLGGRGPDPRLDRMTQEQSNAARINELNATIRYTMWSVFQVSTGLPSERTGLAEEAEALVEQLAGKDVVVRGTYDVSGLRADADLLVWWHAPSSELLQEASGGLRRTALGRHLTPVWSQLALHRPAEFNKSHLPAFLAGEPARAYVCVYPFVRSYEWYLLPDEERRELLAEHGRMARGYP